VIPLGKYSDYVKTKRNKRFPAVVSVKTDSIDHLEEIKTEDLQVEVPPQKKKSRVFGER
jgi:hypothetical protein